jgi:hypothetical protein
VKLHQETYDLIEQIAKKNDESVSETIRTLVDKGLSERVLEQNTDLIAQTVRQQMEIVMKPHTERLAALSSKTGHMASTATFLNVQASMDLVPTEKKKDVRSLYDKARKKAVEYMRTKAEDWNQREEL